ncbi:MAG: hypothetical protein MJ225_04535, partial [Bacilli bacterium]|nr:hypothetical protein [Bacilli bacterium]
MNLPLDIQEKLKEISTNISINQLRDIFEMISSMYLSNTSNGEISLKSKKAVLAYSLSRMPATYSAFYQALIYSLAFINKQDIKSVISLGSGTGSDVLAISNLLNVNKIFSIEKEDEMISLMRYLLSEYQNIEYIKDDFTKLD